jgi:hypothetical protein
MFRQRSASAQNVSEYTCDTIAYTVMSQKSKPFVSFHFETDAVARGHQDYGTHSNVLGMFREDWETGTHSTQCLFWHFIVTHLCLYICICRHIVPFSQHFRPPRYWDSWCAASTWGGTTQLLAWLWMIVPKLLSRLEAQRWWRRVTRVQKKLSKVVRQRVWL